MAHAVIPALLYRDSAWLRDNAHQLILTAPGEAATLLVHLHRTFPGSVDISSLARLVTGLSGEEAARARAEIETGLPNPIRDELLAIFVGNEKPA